MVSLLRASYDEIIQKDGFKGAGGAKAYPGLDLVNGCIRYYYNYNDNCFLYFCSSSISWCYHIYLNLKL